MAGSVFINAQLWHNDKDISGLSNVMDLGIVGTKEETTNMASSGFEESVIGMLAPSWSFSGFREPTAAGDFDQQAFETDSAVPVIATETTNPGAEGDVAHCMNCFRTAYSQPKAVGKVGLYEITMSPAGPDIRGILLDVGTATGAQDSTPGIQHGQVSATQKAYAARAVTAFTGTDATVKVQSDTANNFPSIVNQFTFRTVAGVTAEYKTPVAGPITDEWWRVDITTSGGFSSMAFVVFFGIL